MHSSRSARFRFRTQGMQNPSFAVAIAGKIVFMQPSLRHGIRSTGTASLDCFSGVLEFLHQPLLIRLFGTRLLREPHAHI